MWNNREFKIRLEENAMRDFERIMLTSGACSLFMPMGFMAEDDGEIVCYDCSGFTPLAGYRIERTEDALYILEKLLVILGQAVEYLISPARITLTTDTVFYSKDTGEVKIAYVPMENGAGSLRHNMVAFISQLRRELCDGNQERLDQVARYIYYNNYYIRDLLHKVGVFKRELHMNKAASE